MFAFIGWGIFMLVIWITLGEDAIAEYFSVIFIGGLAIGFGLDRLSKNKKVIVLYFKVFPKHVWKISKQDALSQARIWADITRNDDREEIDLQEIISMLKVDDLVQDIQKTYKQEKIERRSSDAEFWNMVNRIKSDDGN